MTERRWAIESVDPRAFEQLAGSLPGTELQSLLLEVTRRRARERSPKHLLAQYASDGFCRPAAVDLRESLAIDVQLFEAARAFEALELSPVAPLGACSAVGLTDQNRVLSALRGTELVADPTNVLALECARRLRHSPRAEQHLATSQRVIRAQPLPKLPGYAPHFRIFVLASAGHETRDHAFTVESLVRHVRTMLAALDRLEQHGYQFGRRRIDVLATRQRQHLGLRVAAAFGSLATSRPLEHAYYSGGLRYQIWVTAPDGLELPLIDGGVFDWVAKLAANRRAVYVASGAGAQLIALLFRRPGLEPGVSPS